jgi:hypothetical protein
MAARGAILWARRTIAGHSQLSILRDDDGLWLVANTPGIRAAIRLDGDERPPTVRRAFESIATTMGLDTIVA